MANNRSTMALGQEATPFLLEGSGGFISYEYTFGATQPAVNDTIELGAIDPGYQAVDWVVHSDDIDSNGTPTVAWSLGLLNTAKTDLGAGVETWATGIASGQAGVSTRAANNNHIVSTATASSAQESLRRNLALKVTAAAATFSGSGKKVQVIVHLRPVPR